MSEKKKTMEDEIKRILKDNELTIQNNVDSVIISAITDSLKWSVDEEVRDIVQSFMKETITPKVTQMLSDQKEEFTKGLLDATLKAMDHAKDKIVELAEENIKSSYEAKDLVKKLFGIY